MPAFSVVEHGIDLHVLTNLTSLATSVISALAGEIELCVRT